MEEKRRINFKFIILPMVFIIIYILDEFILGGILFEKFAMIREKIVEDGQWYRAFTTQFLHIGPLHLLGNSLALYFAYDFLGRDYGYLETSLVFFLVNLITILIFYFTFNFDSSVGSSPGIFGLVGYWLFWDFSSRKHILLRGTMKFSFLKYYLIISNFTGIDALFIHGLGFFLGGLMGFMGSRLRKPGI